MGKHCEVSPLYTVLVNIRKLLVEIRDSLAEESDPEGFPMDLDPAFGELWNMDPDMFVLLGEYDPEGFEGVV